MALTRITAYQSLMDGVILYTRLVGQNSYTVSSATAFALGDGGAAGSGLVSSAVHNILLSANATFNVPTTMADGQELDMVFTQDGTGGRTVTFSGAWKITWSNTGNTANKISAIRIRRIGSNYVQVGAQTPYV